MSPALATECHSLIFFSLRSALLCSLRSSALVLTYSINSGDEANTIKTSCVLCLFTSLSHSVSFTFFVVVSFFWFLIKKVVLCVFSNIGRVTLINNELVPNKACLNLNNNNKKNSSSNETTYETAIPWSIAWVLNWNNNNIYSNLIANCTMYIAVARFSFHFVAMCVGVGVYLFIPFGISSFFWKVSSQFKYTHRNKKDEKSINPKMGTKQWNFFCKWYHRKFVFDDGIRFD